MESGLLKGTDIGKSPADKPRLSRSHSSSSSLSGEVIRLSSTRSGASDASVKDKQTEEETLASSTPDTGRSTDGSATEIPPTHAMERSTGSSGSPLATSDRIPPHVFARTNTTAPAEWSAASNESLFSLHMGNMSFTKEQLSWMYKSGELCYPSDCIMSGPFVELPSNQTPTRKSTEITKKSGDLNDGRFGDIEAAAAETMREVLREKEDQRKDNIAMESPCIRSLSQHSDASVKSFAFPILTGDADRSVSFKKTTKNKKQLLRPCTPKTTPQTPWETPKPETPKSQTPKATGDAGPKRWFSCFSCCSASS